MRHDSDTICAIATPPGEGGVGIVRLSGPVSLAILRALFRTPGGRPRQEWPAHRLVHGFVVDPRDDTRVDEVLAVYMPRPRSYTGEDVVEFQGHGGPTPLRRIVDLALQRGARSPAPGEYTLRAFLNGRLDLAQAEAVIDVIRARTDLSLRTAMGQFSGKLSARVLGVSDRLLDWMARLEATIDFPEDDIPSVSTQRMQAMAEDILAEVEGLLAGAEQGRILRDGARVAIVGKPNVGKSSLLNALLGESRAIVTEVPGTTRDSIEEWLDVRGIPTRVIDTAGIRHSVDQIESIGVGRARAHLQSAELVLMVLDGSRPLEPEDEDVATLSDGRPRIVVVNKSDLAPAWEDAARLAGGDPVVRVSALSGGNVQGLVQAMADRFTSGLPVGDETVGGNLRHRDALYRAREHVRKARETAVKGLPADFVTIDLRAAVDALGEITGSHITDEVVSRIFSQFCLGK